MSTFQDAAKTTEISQGEMKLISLDGEEIVVANVDGTYFAFGNECTHAGGPLVEGELEGKSVTCPWHATIFDIVSGQPMGDLERIPSPHMRFRLKVPPSKSRSGDITIAM